MSFCKLKSSLLPSILISKKCWSTHKTIFALFKKFRTKKTIYLHIVIWLCVFHLSRIHTIYYYAHYSKETVTIILNYIHRKFSNKLHKQEGLLLYVPDRVSLPRWQTAENYITRKGMIFFIRNPKHRVLFLFIEDTHVPCNWLFLETPLQRFKTPPTQRKSFTLKICGKTSSSDNKRNHKNTATSRGFQSSFSTKVSFGM